jgi:hypothetical protein
MCMEELQVEEVGATAPAPLTDATDAAPVVPAYSTNAAVNVPLNDSQKLVLRTYQSRLATLAKQKGEIDIQIARIEGAMQLDMMKIAVDNKIDPTKFGFSENLDIIPVPPQATNNPSPQRG